MSAYFYPDYYRRTIEQFTRGLKLVLGGTGLGKTSNLAQLLRGGSYPAGVKFIYVANRIYAVGRDGGAGAAPTGYSTSRCPR